MPVKPGHADHGGRHRGVVVRRRRRPWCGRRRRRRRRRPAGSHAGQPHRREDRRAELHRHAEDFLQPADAPPQDHLHHDLDHRAVHGRRRSRHGRPAGQPSSRTPAGSWLASTSLDLQLRGKNIRSLVYFNSRSLSSLLFGRVAIA